ncbi:FKBP-type peptidyl-prolyl cis-trans isomerase [Enterobacteriaceae endosymbiont of Donacia clavipes]|uniref:FKBP-type peptidyl-prolyl cis-trans isomerase n=1 Tax=Enterobacteriaceae endosymbiont of Donacia clavipes TaxID=2675775 RepID=UPI001449CF58|nr:FKBP-type peptidyl-prolyl cis-trans isomerase [Enterobacteriaceae endosymbiont of Donacia clavipes]QJC33395.1 FKBP-type peptidyl-prolyl cis-trans isomerase [Enterobacteriaceae endosymbiont of Donacia clavipes]
MEFFTKKKSIFIILIVIIGLNISNVNAFLLKNTSWWNSKNKNKVVIKKEKIIIKKKSKLKNNKKGTCLLNEQEKMSYALGVSIGKYLAKTFQTQDKLKIVLNKKIILQGVSDVLENKVKISEDEMNKQIQKFEASIQSYTIQETKKEAKQSNIEAKKYIRKFLKEKNTKKTKSGLIYKIRKMGKGKKITNNNMIIVIKYKGKLVDGTIFDNSSSKEPLYISLQEVITGWQEGLKYIRKGGKITLVVPPKLAYGTEIIPGIPNNSTLIFDIELLDIISSVSK